MKLNLSEIALESPQRSMETKVKTQKSRRFPLRLEMAQVLFTSVFYLLMLIILGVIAFNVKLLSYGEARTLEPDKRTFPKQEKFLLALKDKPENTPIKDEVAEKQKVPDINSELDDKKKLDTCFVLLAERSCETEPEPGIPEEQPPSRPKVTTKAVLSPITLFLLGTDTLHTYDPVYEKWLEEKRKRWLNKALRRGRNQYVRVK